MSRMLEALKQIEVMRSRPQPPANKPPADDRPKSCVSVQELPKVPKAESDTAIAAEDPCDADLTGLHPIIQEELNRLHPSGLLVQEPDSSPLTVQYAISDTLTIDETLARAESAVATILEPQAPDIYEDMAQYILTQLMPGRPAALLFTSPHDGTGQTDMLSSLSKILVKHCQGQVFVLDALPHESKLQNERTPDIADRRDHVLEKLKKQYQLVLIDAPSLAQVHTAAMIPHCDGVYLVIRLGYTTPYAVREALRVIQQCGGRLLGSIAVG
ncbi:MAG: hypothetical protein ABSG67_07890 [Thermoguttaceae bacterium]|jgi:hypothetical protein